MKKGIAAILLTLYIAFSSGIVINMHYCMNRFDSTKPGVTKSEMCSKCGMPTTDANGCCHDVVKVIKIQDDQQVSAINFKFNSPKIIAGHVSFHVSDLFRKGIHVFSFSDHSPPFSKQDTYLVNCVFRI